MAGAFSSTTGSMLDELLPVFAKLAAPSLNCKRSLRKEVLMQFWLLPHLPFYMWLLLSVLLHS